MITREDAKYNLHIEMLKQSFQREGDGMTSILLGNATNTAFNFFEKHIDKLEQHIKSLEAQLTNTEQLTCDGCINKPNIGDNYDDICGYCSRFYSDHYTYIEGGLQ